MERRGDVAFAQTQPARSGGVERITSVYDWMMHPENARYVCSACGVELLVREQGYEENLDGGPYALTIRLSCPSCQKESTARWLMRAVKTARGVELEPELLQLTEPAILENTRTT